MDKPDYPYTWFKPKFIYIHETMDNQNHCMSIKQARLIVNAHKHNLLINSFCNESLGNEVLDSFKY